LLQLLVGLLLLLYSLLLLLVGLLLLLVGLLLLLYSLLLLLVGLLLLLVGLLQLLYTLLLLLVGLLLLLYSLLLLFNRLHEHWRHTSIRHMLPPLQSHIHTNSRETTHNIRIPLQLTSLLVLTNSGITRSNSCAMKPIEVRSGNFFFGNSSWR
jgi:hypothetical protein